ncbi:TPA: electron transporter RnfE [Candidatus Uhrbacteria bacterium]|nr:electron transporter RnfE [Candidatus Uhrbacteria bacterium]
MMNYGLAGFIGWLFMFLWWVLIVAGIIALAKWVMGKCPQCSRKNAPIEILKERYAKGEIDEKEFARKKKALEMK